jgi:hypothetical protein
MSNQIDLIKPLPNDAEAERVTLGLAVDQASGQDFLPQVLKELSPEDFYNPTYASIRRMIGDEYERGTPIELSALIPACERYGIIPADLAGMVIDLPTANNATHYLRKVKLAGTNRKLHNALYRASERILHNPSSEPEALLSQLRETLEGLEKTLPQSAHRKRISAENLQTCLLTGGDLRTAEVRRNPALLDEWLCVGDLGYIFAPRGVGKTWLGLSLPLAISKGQALGEWHAGEQQAGVLYIDGEMPLALMKERHRSLNGSDHGITYLHHDKIFEKLDGSLNIALSSHQEAITGIIIENGYDCLVLDNLSCLASGLDENQGTDHEAIANWLLELRRRKITVIFIHHAGRSGTMRGHSKREDACSWILQLTDAKVEGEEGAKFISHFAKPSRNTSKAMPDLLWHFTTPLGGATVIECTPAELSEYEQFIQHVMDGVESQKDIADMMSKNKGTICKWAKRAVDSGRICKAGDRLTPPKL